MSGDARQRERTTRPLTWTELPTTVATPRTVLLVVAMLSLVLTTSGISYLWFVNDLPITTATMPVTASAGLAGVAATALGAVVAFVVPLRRRRGLVGLDRPSQAPVRDRVEEIAARFGLTGAYRLAAAPLDAGLSAHVRPGRGRAPVVVLSGGLLAAHTTDRRLFDGVVAHELAHIRNRDVLPTALTIAVWRSTIVFGVLPQLYFLTLGERWSDRIRFLVLVVMVYVVRTMVLRSREYWADVQAGAAGYGDQIREVLASAPPEPAVSWRSVFSLHPARRARIRALGGARLAGHAVPVEGALLAGVTVGLTLGDLATWTSNQAGVFTGPGTATAVALLIVPVLPLVPFVWASVRLMAVDELRWTARHSAGLLVAFSAGTAAGNAVGGLSPGGLRWLGLEGYPPQLVALIVAGLFALAGLIGIGWSAGVLALWSDGTVPASRWSLRALCGIAVAVTVAVVYSVETVLIDVLLPQSPLPGVERASAEAAATAATAPWAVPYWFREMNTGSAVQVLLDWITISATLVLLAVPLLVRLVRRPPRRRTVLAGACYLLLAVLVNAGLAVLILGGPDGAGLSGARYDEFVHNVKSVSSLVALLAGGVAALLVAVIARRGAIVLGASAGAFAFVLLKLLHAFAGTPLRCALVPGVPDGCSSFARPVWETLLIAVGSVGVGLLFCAVVAGVARVLLVTVRPLVTGLRRL